MAPILSDILSLNSAEQLSTGDSDEIKTASKKDIAIIGMGVRLPRANSMEEFWENTRRQVEVIRDLPEIRKNDANRYVGYCKPHFRKEYAQIAYLDEIDKFDYRFFNIAPKEAGLLDPNQRLFFETTWQAIEDAGYGGDKLVGSRTGVYIGFRADDFFGYRNLIMDVEPDAVTSAFIPNLTSIMAGRISYLLDLKGPSMVVDTACSSSLVAVHLACQAIKNKECDLAIAGGVRINILPFAIRDKLGIESSDGKARTFDDAADGTGIGEGVVAVLLKPLHKALRDNDHVYAVIKGSAVNQDGSSVGLTAPNVLAQEEVIVQAWKDAGIDPETITYIEAHGTGTPLGDPIEVDGIQRAFRRFTAKKQFCAIGSVKTNLGHLDNVAGIAGLVQTVAALQHKIIPPSFHFNKPNQRITFEDSPVYVNDRPVNWETGENPRRCGLSSFGLSGTNCHMILEEFMRASDPEPVPEKCWSVLTLSAKSEQAFQGLIELYQQFVLNSGDEVGLDLADICYTANTGRGHYGYRLALIAQDMRDLRESIRSFSGFVTAGLPNPKVYCGYHKVIADNRKTSEAHTLTESEARRLSAEAVEKIKVFQAGGKIDTDILEKICDLYVKGAKVDWELLYRDESHKRISLPVYPFEKSRCWLEIPEVIETVPEEINRYLYEMRWEKEALPKSGPALIPEILLIFTGTGILADKIFQMSTAKYREVIMVSPGPQFRQIDENHYQIANQESDYLLLLETLCHRNVSAILHLMTLSSGDHELKTLLELENSQKQGVYSLFYLAKAVSKFKLKLNLKLMLLSNSVHEITGAEPQLHPENATLFGFGKVMALENPNCHCSYLDVDEGMNVDDIFFELQNPKPYLVAYRNGDRYVEQLGRLRPTVPSGPKATIQKDGVYLITGGTGGVGLEIGKYLAARQPVKLVLIGRSGIPERGRWEEIIREGADQKLISRIIALREIEAKGAAVDIYAADVAVAEDLKRVLAETKQKYGKINGIIHCAGIAGSGFSVNESEGQFAAVLAPKVSGTWLLDHLTHPEPPDFLILFSSLVSIGGAAGMGDYVAANAFLGAYAAYRSRRGKPTLAIDWTVWNRTGMAGNIDPLRANNAAFQGIAAALAVKIFDAVLTVNRPRIIAGEFNYGHPSFPEMIRNANLKLTGELHSEIMRRMRAGDTDSEPAQPLNTAKPAAKSGAARADVIRRLTDIWRQNLGYAEIGIQDNFFEIGGDSLKINQIYAAIETDFPGKVTTADLFLYPTIAELSDYIMSLDNSTDSSGGTNNGERMIENEIEKLLNESSQSPVANLQTAAGSEGKNAEEMKITQIWREKLGYDQINRHDNFFEIGGDSIILNKIHALIEEAFPGKVTVADLFLYPTIAELVEYISSSNETDEAWPNSTSDNAAEKTLEAEIAKLLEES